MPKRLGEEVSELQAWRVLAVGHLTHSNGLDWAARGRRIGWAH
jgi:hypothetical protein